MIQITTDGGGVYEAEDAPVRRGGHTEVHRARSEGTGFVFAAKIARTLAGNEALRREAHHHRSLSSHHAAGSYVVPFEALGTTADGRAALILRWVGDTLADWVQGRTVRDRLVVSLRVCDALTTLHATGEHHPYVHGDVKPWNVLIEEDAEEEPAVFLTDFGMSCRMGDGEAAEPSLLGTDGYMPPEQASSGRRTATQAWDVHGVAATVFHAFVERPPAPPATPQPSAGPDRAALLEALGRGHPRPSSPAFPRIAAALCRALDPDPVRRGTALDLARALGGALSILTSELEQPGAAPSPGETRRRIRKAIVPVFAEEDLHAVEERIWTLQSYCDFAFDPGALRTAPVTEEERRTLRETLVGAEQVWVYWSAAARRSAYVGAVRALVAEIEAEERSSLPIGSEGGRTRLVTWPLDRTPLPRDLPQPVGGPIRGPAPAGARFWSVLEVVSASSAFGLLYWGIYRVEQGIVWLGVVAALAALSVFLAGARWLGRGELFVGAGEVYRWGRWLERADVVRAISLSRNLLDRIYGPRVWSRRSIGVAFLLGNVTIAIFALLWLSGAVLASGGDIDPGNLNVLWSLLPAAPLVLLNLAFDMTALASTRWIHDRILQRPTRGRIITCLGADAVAATAAGLGPIVLNVFPLLLLEQSHGDYAAFPIMVYAHLAGLLSGRLRILNLARDVSASFFLISGVTVVTGLLPTLIPGALLSLMALNALSRGELARVGGDALRRLADRPSGPQEVVVPIGLVLTALLTYATTPATAEPSPAQWSRSIRQDSCTPPCPMGRPESDPLGFVDEAPRAVSLRASYRIQRTELTQEQWASVWDRAEPQVDLLGLPRQPSLHVGSNLPVETVSWCEAARFCNLYSTVEGLRPPYRGDVGDPLRLDGCEQGAPVYWDRTADGYRLPTEVEWEVAARGCLPGAGCGGARSFNGATQGDLFRAAWVLGNSGWGPHPVGGKLSNPLQLNDMLGNVAEWVWDEYDPMPGDGVDPAPARVSAARVFRGGSWDDSAKQTRNAFRGGGWPDIPQSLRFLIRDGGDPRFRADNLGFRLARGAEGT